MVSHLVRLLFNILPFNILINLLQNKEIAYEEFEILHEQSKKGGTGEINTVFWKQNRVVIKKVNIRADPAVCSRNFVHEVSSSSSLDETLILNILLT